MHIGDRLKEERERLCFNQTDLSGLGGASLRSQIDWEKGKSFPNGKVLAAYAAAGADVQYILTGMRSITLAVKPVTGAQKIYVLKAVTETVQNASPPLSADIKPLIVQILYGLVTGEIDQIDEAISIIKGQSVIDFEKSSYAYSNQAQGQKMAAEQNPGYSGLCQAQKILLEDFAQCAPEDQEAIQRMAQLAAKAKKEGE